MSESLERFLSNHPSLNREGSQEDTRAVWGGIAAEYDTLQANIKIASSDSAVMENLAGEMLDELVMRTTGIQRITNETDLSRLKIMNVFFRRSGAGSWATTHAIRGAYIYYFPSSSIYIRENAIETNLITDGSFEAFAEGPQVAPFGDWVPTGAGIEVAIQSSFHGAKCLKGTGTGSVYQDVTVAGEGPCILTTAYLGKLPVSLQRLSDNKYWNPVTMAWQADSTSIMLENTSELYAIDERIVLVESADTIRVKYGPDSLGGEYCIDYLSFGVKPGYPFIQVLVATFGQNGEFLNSWPGAFDPVLGADYDNATFLGRDFIGGNGGGVPVAYYQTILDYIKPAGVKALFEFVGSE